MEQSKVSVDLKEYNEFVISQYENGKIKTSVLDDIKTLKKELSILVETHAKQVIDDRSYNPKKSLVLDLAFKRNRMGADSRSEQINIGDEYIGNYAGFTKNNIVLLEALGINRDEMIAFINIQWDIKDAADKTEKDAAEEKARLDALSQKEDN